MPEHDAGSAQRWDTWQLLAEWQKDPQKTLGRLRNAANAGDVRVQRVLGQIHCEGRGVPLDAAEGLHWYRLAAHAGDAPAMNMVGRCHELGWGTRTDAFLAAAWYRLAARRGYPWGLYNYANLLATGRGVEQDGREALRLYRAAAERGHARSMNLVGRYLEEGWACPRDAEAAHDWYRRSAEAGDFRGQASHAFVIAKQGRVAEATAWLQRAVEAASPAFLEHLRDQLPRSASAEFRAIGKRATKRLANATDGGAAR